MKLTIKISTLLVVAGTFSWLRSLHSRRLKRHSPLPDSFMTAIAQHCGQAFAGRVSTDVPQQADSSFAGKELIMHVRECGEDELKVPFHVGDDHSRTCG